MGFEYVSMSAEVSEEVLETVCKEVKTSQDCGVETNKPHMDVSSYSEPQGVIYESKILAAGVRKDNVNVVEKLSGEDAQEISANIAEPLKGTHTLQQVEETTEQSEKEPSSSEYQDSASLLQTFQNVGVTSANQQTVVICLEDSIYACSNQESNDDRPLNVKVYSMSANNATQGSHVSIVMKEKYSGPIPVIGNISASDISTEPKKKLHSSSINHNTLKCPKCPAAFTATAHSKFQVHLKQHDFGDGHSCQHCGRCFRRKTDMARHIKRLHSWDQTKHQCHLCEKSYKDYTNFQQHIKTKHKGIYRYTCQDCGRGYNRLMEYKVHLSTHTGEKLYKCDLCSEQFLRKNYLTVHMRKHTGELPFQCLQCNKKFIDSSKLAHHRRVHIQFKEVLKKKQCSFCHKRFEAKRDLENHERTHTGDKPFSCGICEKSYSAKSSLKEHQKVHGERQLFCPVCKKGFHKGFTLKEHMKIHTEEMPFVCQYCAKRYRYGSNFRAHEKSCGKK